MAERDGDRGDSIEGISDGSLLPGSITISSIYDSIRNLNIEEKALILSNYKISDLYKMYNNQEEFDKYLEFLRENADLYTRTADALAVHRGKAVEEGGVKYESNMVRTMEDAYDNMSEWGQEKFCQEMAERPGFFQTAYRVIMGKLCSAWKDYKNDYKGQQ